MPSKSKFTRDNDGNVAVRIVSNTGVSEQPDSMFTTDEGGNVAVRVVFGEGGGGGGGGDSHNLGYYQTPEALRTAHPTATAGDFAIVNSTDTVWLWDTDTSSWKDGDTKGQVTSVNNQTGAVTVQETLVSGTNIKTVDGNSLLGSGNLELSTYLTYPNTWTTTGTTKAFCDDIAADSSAVEGKAYLGEVTLSDLPASMANGEVVVEIMKGTTALDKVIILSLKSGNVSPYSWQYVYWNNGSNVSGWKTWQETLVSGTNIKTINNTSILGSGDITTEEIQVSTMPTAGADELGKVYQFIGTTDANYTHGYFYECVSDGGNPATYSWSNIQVQMSSGGLPSQTGNAGKFLVTDGTDASWSDTVTGLKVVNSSDSTNYTTLSSTGNLLIQEGTYWRRTQLVTYNAPNEICFILATSRTGTGSAIGAPNSRIGRVYTNKINNGADINVPTVGGTLALQIATMPTAGSTYEGMIYQFTGITDSTYTNGHFYKCVSDGQTPATYSWEEVQLGGGGSSYTAGTGIDITSGVISTVVPMGMAHTSQSGESSVYFNTSPLADNKKACVVVGEWAGIGDNAATVTGSIVIGNQTSGTSGSVAIGYHASTGLASYSAVKSNIAIGSYARITGNTTHHAIQLGAVGNGTYSDNYDENTFKVANANGNFEMMDANGNLPADRLASTTGLADGNYRLRLTMANGVPTLSWVAE